MKEIITDILKQARDDSDFANSDDFINEGLLDSFDLITISGELEDSFGITIEADDIVPANFTSIAAIEELVEKCKRG